MKTIDEQIDAYKQKKQQLDTLIEKCKERILLTQERGGKNSNTYQILVQSNLEYSKEMGLYVQFIKELEKLKYKVSIDKAISHNTINLLDYGFAGKGLDTDQPSYRLNKNGFDIFVDCFGFVSIDRNDSESIELAIETRDELENLLHFIK